MTKRIRKKRRVGEFQELGFELRARLRAGADVASRECFVDEFATLVEAAGLSCGGGGAASEFAFFITHVKRGSVSEAEREALLQRVRELASVVECGTGPLVDAWSAANREGQSYGRRPISGRAEGKGMPRMESTR